MRNQSLSHEVLIGECIASQPQSNRATPRPTLSQFVSLSLLMGFFLVGFAVQAQDSSNSQQLQDSPKQQKTESKEVSGFLGDYSGLYPDPKNGDLLIYEKSKDVLKDYHKFTIDPVTIYLLPEAAQSGIDPDDLDRLAHKFHDTIVDELTKGGYEVVSEPGRGVLDVHLAITNVEPTGAKKNIALKAGATAASVAVAPGASLLVPRLSVGKASVEGELLDSVSGDRIAAFVTSKSGRRWFSGLKGYKQWGDVEAAFRTWAKNFTKRLDEARSVSASK
jgi:hypothetical protein